MGEVTDGLSLKHADLFDRGIPPFTKRGGELTLKEQGGLLIKGGGGVFFFFFFGGR